MYHIQLERGTKMQQNETKTSYLNLLKNYANFSESQSDCEKLKTADVSKLARHHNNFFP